MNLRGKIISSKTIKSGTVKRRRHRKEADIMTIGEKIRSERIRLGLSQDEIAKQLNTTKQAIYKYESGVVTNIPTDKIELLSKIFGVSPSYLVGWEDESTDRDQELDEYLEELRSRPEMRTLFSLARSASREDVERTVAIIEALRKGSNG